MKQSTTYAIVFSLCVSPFAIRPLSTFIKGPTSPESSTPPPPSSSLEDEALPPFRTTQHALRAQQSFDPPAGLKPELSVSPTRTGEAALQEKLKDSIEEEYDFSESDLKSSDVVPYYNPHRPPLQINYYGQPGEPEVVRPRRDRRSGSTLNGGILNLTSEALAGRIALERKREAGERTPPPRSSSDSANRDQKFIPLSESAWTVVHFTPGKNQEGKPIRLRKPVAFSIQGPDYSMAQVGIGNQAQVERLREKVLSFGHAGELVLGVKDGGIILDEAGADFSVYENVFAIGGGILYQEFARVGVSETLDEPSFRWFECDPERGNLSGCAGVVPTDEGGDAFDLGTLGLKAIRFIKIRDWGKNNDSRDLNTEGFDLDAVRYHHAYQVHP